MQATCRHTRTQTAPVEGRRVELMSYFARRLTA
jgi:hypothetical protein